ncbi:MAG: nrdD protein [Desulfovibrio sp.]|nr:nrdD protein [Desulfovibrio sp.]
MTPAVDHWRTHQTDTGGAWIIGQGVRFERIRRITGYLVGTTDRFNDAKRAEERDRVKHSSEGLYACR